MIGIDPLTAGSLLIMAAGVVNTAACPEVPPTKINVVPVSKEIQYDHSRTLAQIQSVQSDTIDPHGFHGMTQTQGFMEGQIKLEPKIKLNYKSLPLYNGMCLWYETIDVTIEIDPKIVVAQEVYADPCMKKAVIEHEMKHIKTDRKIVNKYSKIIGAKVYEALKQRGFKVGPVKADAAQGIADRMQKTIYQIIEHEYKKMDLERIDEQRAVDNINEYDAVSAQCPAFKASQEKAATKKKSKVVW